jgi:hypothetical protein
MERLGTWRAPAERHPAGGEYSCASGALLALPTTGASLGALGLTAFLGSLAITRETEVIGLPQQTLACAEVVVAAGAQLSQVMLAGVIRWCIAVRQKFMRRESIRAGPVTRKRILLHE